MKLNELTENIFKIILDTYLEKAYSNEDNKDSRKNKELFTGQPINFDRLKERLKKILPQYRCGESDLRLGCKDYNGMKLIFFYYPQRDDEVIIMVDPHLNSSIEDEDKNLYDKVERLSKEIEYILNQKIQSLVG